MKMQKSKKQFAKKLNSELKKFWKSLSQEEADMQLTDWVIDTNNEFYDYYDDHNLYQDNDVYYVVVDGEKIEIKDIKSLVWNSYRVYDVIKPCVN